LDLAGTRQAFIINFQFLKMLKIYSATNKMKQIQAPYIDAVVVLLSLPTFEDYNSAIVSLNT
jgi:hypothetical protein